MAFAAVLDLRAAKALKDILAGGLAGAGPLSIDAGAVIAPGDRHLSIFKSGGFYQCRLTGGALVNGHMPSVDVLFDSCAAEARADAVGLLMTGMGRDGAEGLRRMRNAGASTACQDEASSLIYGMPKAAMTIGAAEREVALDAIPAYILEQARAARKSKDVKAS